MRTSFTALVPFLLAGSAFAMCPGYTYGIGHQISLGGGFSRWNVYDSNCNVVDGLTTNQNACFQGIFGCSPEPVIFNQYTNSFTGQRYSCRTDSNSGVCGSDAVSVCCR